MTFLVVGTRPCAEQKSHTPEEALTASCLGSSPVHKRKSGLLQDSGSMLARQSCLWLPLRFCRRVFPQQTACIPTVHRPSSSQLQCRQLLSIWWAGTGGSGMGWACVLTMLTTPAHLHPCPHTRGKRTSQTDTSTGKRLLFSCLLSTTSEAMAGAAVASFQGPLSLESC